MLGGSLDKRVSIFDLDVLSGVVVSCLGCSEPGGWDSELVDMVMRGCRSIDSAGDVDSIEIQV